MLKFTIVYYICTVEIVRLLGFIFTKSNIKASSKILNYIYIYIYV